MQINWYPGHMAKARRMLQENLKQEGIISIVEEQNVEELLRINNWNYSSSYKITKMWNIINVKQIQKKEVRHGRES